MAFLNEDGVATWTSEIKARADAAYAAINHSHGSFDFITEKTTAEWNRDTSYIPKKGELCVWTDYARINNKDVPAIKIGDGLAYAIDLPFVGDDVRYDVSNHINNMNIHIVPLERTMWNDKVNASIYGENLIFSN